MSTIAESLELAVRSLFRHSDSPRLDAELLLGKVLGLSRSALIARGALPVGPDSEQRYARLIEERRGGSPVAYLTGTREFWSLPLSVTPAVLVPRPETEVLVELALDLLPADVPWSILDLGTGSGAIALAITSERPRWRVTGVDVSADALAVAMQNSRALDLSRVEWLLGSWFDAVPGRRFDMIVANPPYVAAGDPALERLSAEPAIALCAGPTGLEAPTAIVANARLHLSDRGWLVMEHGREQAAQIAALLERHGFKHIRSAADFSGNPRVTLGTVHTQH